MTGYEIDHIGVAVRSLEKSIPFYTSLGFREIHIEEVPTEKVRVAFIEFDNQAAVELLEPTSNEGVIAKYLGTRGEGIHHICFRTKDIMASLEKLKDDGFRTIDETPRPGAKECLVAFVHPKAANGVLIELSQKKS